MKSSQEIEAQREILNQLTKQVIKRIKEVQQETNEAYTQEDVWIKQGIERELINWKISLEKWRKKLKYSIES